MGIDFDKLVLNAALSTFGMEFDWYPVKSRPTTDNLPIRIRAVFSSGPIDVAMADGQIFSDQKTTIGVRLSELPFQPERGDRFKYLKTGVMYWQDDLDEDGQGGAEIVLRLTVPEGDL
jgi:hypothetical protein